MSCEAISTEAAPKAIGPYSQAIRAGGLIFVSGQIPVDPATGNLASDDVVNQTKQVISNLSAVLHAAGATLSNVASTTIFLTDLNDFQSVNAVYGAAFPDTPPARATVEVSALPLGARVEISLVAVAPS